MTKNKIKCSKRHFKKRQVCWGPKGWRQRLPRETPQKAVNVKYNQHPLCLGDEFLDSAPGSQFSLLLVKEKVHLEDTGLHKPEDISWLSRFSTLAQAPCSVSEHPKAKGMGRVTAWRCFLVWMSRVCIVNFSFLPLAQQWPLPLLFAIWVSVCWTFPPLTHRHFQCSHSNTNRRHSQNADI